MGVDRARIEAAVAELLAAIGDDPTREGLRATPRRVAEAYEEFFSGMGTDASEHLSETFPVAEAAGSELVGPGDAVLLRDIAFRSICEHHLLPFLGVAHIAYLPGAEVVGLGKLPRVVETFAARPQIQERLTEQIAQALEDGLEPRGVLVVVDAVHGCVTSRGVRQSGSSTVTVAARGELADPVARTEIMALIGSGRLGSR